MLALVVTGLTYCERDGLQVNALLPAGMIVGLVVAQVLDVGRRMVVSRRVGGSVDERLQHTLSEWAVDAQKGTRGGTQGIRFRTLI